MPTTQDYTTMPAGREMDARIHAEIFGRPVKYVEYEFAFHTWADELFPGNNIHHAETPGWYETPGDDRAGIRVRRIPAYSTDIAAAWPVMTRLHGQAERWARFDAELRRLMAALGATGIHELEPSVAAHTICRAALAELAHPEG